MTDLTNRRPVKVDPYDVEHGDVILGTTATVDRVAFDGLPGRWYYTSSTGQILWTAGLDQPVTVWRDTTGRYLDWCQPRGIRRPS